MAPAQPQFASTDPGRWCLIKSSASKRVGRFGKQCGRVGVDSPSSAAAWRLEKLLSDGVQGLERLRASEMDFGKECSAVTASFSFLEATATSPRVNFVKVPLLGFVHFNILHILCLLSEIDIHVA